MCSTCDCDKPPIQDVTELLEDNKRQCRKCNSDSYILLNKVHAECKACFLESCHKKFRSTIGRSKLVKNNESILISYSGGSSSSALMDLVKSSIENKFQREKKFKPSVFHVDTYLLGTQSILDNNARTSSHNTRSERLKQLLQETRQNYPGWPIYWTTLESYFDHNTKNDASSVLYAKYDEQNFSSIHPLLNNSNSASQLKLHLATMDLTDQQQFIRTMIEAMVSKVASHINEHSIKLSDNPTKPLSFVFAGTSATRLANNLLVDVILGQGSSIHSTVNVCDKRHVVPILRPMRDFSKKEVAYYLHARNLEPKLKLNLATLTNNKESIQRLSEVFLCRLYTDYPATYSTLLRTGNKMHH